MDQYVLSIIWAEYNLRENCISQSLIIKMKVLLIKSIINRFQVSMFLVDWENDTWIWYIILNCIRNNHDRPSSWRWKRNDGIYCVLSH